MTFRATCSKHDSEPLEFTDYDALAAHMKTAHSASPVRMPKAPGAGPKWRGPRLSEDGRPLEPTGLDAGAHLTWTEYVEVGQYFDHDLGRTVPRREKVTRTGQVWSKAGPTKSVWVIPDEPLDMTELAVLVREQTYVLPGEPAFTHSGTHNSMRRRDVA